MLLEIHMLKNYPPTNLNRDDTGAPKTCVFGGFTRGRISSQCLKRSWRKSEIFKAEIGEKNLGVRTRTLPSLVAEKLLEMGTPPEYVELIKPLISKFGSKEKNKNDNKASSEKKTKDDDKTAQVMFFSPQDIETVANAIKSKLDGCSSKNEVKKLKADELQKGITDASKRSITLDIALFGRMVTCDAFRDVEASMQVAHAISTNKVCVESDYFAAMDDRLGSTDLDEKGAAMLGDMDYNASCYYIYASLDTDKLRDNLNYTEDAEGIVQRAIPALLRAMALTNPSGKQNSFAGPVMPSAVLVECKDKKIPTSMVNAFVRPVISADLVEESIHRLADEVDMMKRNFGLSVKERFWFCVDKYDIRPKCVEKSCESFPKLVEAVISVLA